MQAMQATERVAMRPARHIPDTRVAPSLRVCCVKRSSRPDEAARVAAARCASAAKI
jgi:hypothetical protein